MAVVAEWILGMELITGLPVNLQALAEAIEGLPDAQPVPEPTLAALGSDWLFAQALQQAQAGSTGGMVLPVGGNGLPSSELAGLPLPAVLHAPAALRPDSSPALRQAPGSGMEVLISVPRAQWPPAAMRGQVPLPSSISNPLPAELAKPLAPAVEVPNPVAPREAPSAPLPLPAAQASLDAPPAVIPLRPLQIERASSMLTKSVVEVDVEQLENAPKRQLAPAASEHHVPGLDAKQLYGPLRAAVGSATRQEPNVPAPSPTVSPATPPMSSTASPLDVPALVAPDPAMPPPRWSEMLSTRIRWMVDHKMSEARVKLHPPELGALEIKVSVVDDKTYVQMIAQQSAARDAIAQSLPRLREVLAEGGMDLGGATVSGGEKQLARDDSAQVVAERAEPEEPAAPSVRIQATGEVDLYA